MVTYYDIAIYLLVVRNIVGVYIIGVLQSLDQVLDRRFAATLKSQRGGFKASCGCGGTNYSRLLPIQRETKAVEMLLDKILRPTRFRVALADCPHVIHPAICGNRSLTHESASYQADQH